VLVKVAECLYRNQSSGTYYALVKRGGKQFRRSLKTTDRAMAGRLLVDYRRKVERLTAPAEARQVTFEELAKVWFASASATLKSSSALRRELAMRQLFRFFGKMPVRQITRRDCETWVSQHAGQVSASTYNKEVETLRLVLEYAKREGIVMDNAAENLRRRKMEKGKMVIPSKEQFRLLVETLRACGSRYQQAADLVELLAFSGMRLAEGTSLRWEDVDFVAERFVVTGGEVGTKNHEARPVPLFPALRGFLQRKQSKGHPAHSDLVVGIGSAKNAMASACAKAGLPDFTHHHLRHFFVSNAIEAGVDFKTIAAWVGHKDGGVLVAKTYGHLRDTHSAEMAKRMVYGVGNYKEGSADLAAP
jgi:integrase